MMRSLQDLCLEEIISNFKIFNLAYHTTKDVNLLSKFEFLQRLYSFELVTSLQNTCCLRLDYLDFVINKHLKRLYTTWIEDFPWDAVEKKISEVGPSLEIVYCFGNKEPWERIICYLTNLKFFHYEAHCNNKIISDIAKFCPKIESIIIHHSTDVSNLGIKHLCQNLSGEVPCPSLKQLEISDTRVDDDSIKCLIQSLPSLEKIDYHRLPEVLYSIHKSNINHLGGVKPYNLTHLILDKVSTSPVKNDIYKICFSLCPHLQSLSLPVFTQEHLDFCFQLSELKELHLDCFKSPPLSINDLLKLKGNRLLSLTFKNFSVSVSVLTQNCPKLTSLVMDNVTYECNETESMPLLHNLEKISFEKLTMTDCVTTEAVICLLSSSLNLKHMEFQHCSMFSSDIKHQILKICMQSKLRNINFSYSAVEFEFVKNVLLACSSLEVLSLDGCSVSTNYSEIDALEVLTLTLSNSPLLCYSEDPDFMHDDFTNDFDDDYRSYDDILDYDDDDDYGNYDDDIVDYDDDYGDYDDDGGE